VAFITVICKDTDTDTYITIALLPVAFITVICKDTDTDTYITTSLLPVHLLPRSVKIQILMTLMRQIYN
jgi:hypothetical protein